MTCECGCGTELDPAPYKGRVRRFAHGHNRRRPMAERFWALVDRRGPDECWPWLGGKIDTGYGRFGHEDGRVVPAHQVAYQLGHGQPVPAGLEPDHTCHRRDCQNPAHLEAVTHRENLRRRRVPA